MSRSSHPARFARASLAAVAVALAGVVATPVRGQEPAPGPPSVAVSPARAFGTVRDLPADAASPLVLRIDPGVPAADPDFPPGTILVTRHPETLAPGAVILLLPQRTAGFAAARVLAGRPARGDEAVLPRGDLADFVEGALGPGALGKPGQAAGQATP